MTKPIHPYPNSLGVEDMDFLAKRLKQALIFGVVSYALIISFIQLLWIYTASKQNWIMRLDYNYYGEGLIELYFVFPLINLHYGFIIIPFCIILFFMSYALYEHYKELKQQGGDNGK